MFTLGWLSQIKKPTTKKPAIAEKIKRLGSKSFGLWDFRKAWGIL
jgi:hypothetical protein